jgi:hypothetical protein
MPSNWWPRWADRLVPHIDRFDTNEPVEGAQVEVDTGTMQAKATQSSPGVLGGPGHAWPAVQAPLTITIETEDTADLLTATLEVPAAPPHRQRPDIRPWMAGTGRTLLLSGAGLLALRRRPRVTTPGSPMTSAQFSRMAAAWLLVLHGAAFAHGGEDHDHGPAAALLPATGTTAPSAWPTAACSFPKAIQRQWACAPCGRHP